MKARVIIEYDIPTWDRTALREYVDRSGRYPDGSSLDPCMGGQEAKGALIGSAASRRRCLRTPGWKNRQDLWREPHDDRAAVASHVGIAPGEGRARARPPNMVP